jgi:Zinc finger, C4 type (two domains)
MWHEVLVQHDRCLSKANFHTNEVIVRVTNFSSSLSAFYTDVCILWNSISTMAVSQASVQTVISVHSADEESESDSSHDVPSPKKRQKKKSIDADKKPSTVPEPMLPPCRICPEKASGFHYGANTCEACKVCLKCSHAYI